MLDAWSAGPAFYAELAHKQVQRRQPRVPGNCQRWTICAGPGLAQPIGYRLGILLKPVVVIHKTRPRRRRLSV